MFYRWAAPVLVLALCAMMPRQAAGQQKSPGHGRGAIGTSYPNPFNPTVTIPFSVGDEVCGVNEQHVVTVRILNILAQPVVFPVLLGPAPGSTATISTSLNGQRINNLTLGCGHYQAFWDGHIAATGREAASGTFAVQVIVDGQLVGTKKIFHAK